MMSSEAMTAAPPAAASFGYPASAMAGDYLRAVAGLAPAVLILALVPVGRIAAVVLCAFAAIFAAFALRTALRHATRLECDETGLRAIGPRRAVILWERLDRFKLAYYSTRRDRKSGWMQLELAAGRARLGADSRLDGFERLVRRAALAAAARGVTLSPASAANLEALGIRLPDLQVAP